jgi:uncharacterized protein
MPDPFPLSGPIDLDALDAFLMSDRAPEASMGLSDLDGFLTGVVVGPELIMPSEWMSVIWGGDGPDFESMEEAQAILGTITGRYDEILRRLEDDPTGLDPVFWEGPGGQVIAADWAAGFLDAVRLRPKAWKPLIRHPDARVLMVPILVLGADDPEDVPFGAALPPEDEAAKLREVGSDILIDCVIGIHAFWRERRVRPVPRPQRRPAGRNADRRRR